MGVRERDGGELEEGVLEEVDFLESVFSPPRRPPSSSAFIDDMFDTTRQRGPFANDSPLTSDASFDSVATPEVSMNSPRAKICARRFMLALRRRAQVRPDLCGVFDVLKQAQTGGSSLMHTMKDIEGILQGEGPLLGLFRDFVAVQATCVAKSRVLASKPTLASPAMFS